jgi:hypothetical protein
MHAIERVLSHYFIVLLGPQGLNHDMTLAQGLYKAQYYSKKNEASRNALIVESVGGNWENFKKADPALRNQTGFMSATRWTSASRVSLQMVKRLDVPASDELITLAASLCGGQESSDWLSMVPIFKCINKDDISAEMLILFCLSNTAPGGKKGESVIGCAGVLSCFGSPENRIALFVASAFHKIHLRWAGFCDGKTELSTAECISTRFREKIRNNRLFIKQMNELSRNWKSFLPGVHEFIEKEATRAEALGLGNKKHIITNYDKKMKKATKTTIPLTFKYWVEPDLKAGFSLAQNLDPHVGPFAARAILAILRKLGMIEFDENITYDFLVETNSNIPFAPMPHNDLDEGEIIPCIDLMNYEDIENLEDESSNSDYHETNSNDGDDYENFSCESANCSTYVSTNQNTDSNIDEIYAQQNSHYDDHTEIDDNDSISLNNDNINENIDNNNSIDNNSVDNNENNNHICDDNDDDDSPWDRDSKDWAYPGIPMRQYIQMIMEGFIELSPAELEGIVNAYGLKNKYVINELLLLANGDLLKQLNENIEDWEQHDHISISYWKLYQMKYPALADTIEKIFGYICITNTPVEQLFSCADQQIRGNQSADTNARNMDYVAKMKHAIARGMRYNKKNEGEKRVKHLFRSKSNQNEFMHKLHDSGQRLCNSLIINSKVKTKTIKELIKDGKKMNELKQLLPYTRVEMAANMTSALRVGALEVRLGVKNASIAKAEDLSVMPEVVKTKFEILALELLTEELRNYLKEYFINDSDLCDIIKRAKKIDSPPEFPQGLMTLIIPYWMENSDAFLLVVNREKKPEKNKLQKHASSLKAKAMKDILINYYKNKKPNAENLRKLERTKILKGDFNIPDTLVSMMLIYWDAEGIDPLVLL